MSRNPKHPLLVRQAALLATQGKFKNEIFDWGRADCWMLARFHLRKMGYRPPATPRYRSALGARKALKTKGFKSMTAALDSFLTRIPPASMLPGDLAAVAGTEGLDAIMVCAGRKMLGWHEGAETPVFIIPEPGKIDAAWRVNA